MSDDSNAPGPVCNFCGVLLTGPEVFVTDKHGAFHVECAPARATQAVLNKIEMLTQAHTQHTETVRALEARVAKLEHWFYGDETEKNDGA